MEEELKNNPKNNITKYNFPNEAQGDG